MARAGSVIPVRLSRRMCRGCGFDGGALQPTSDQPSWVCPRCGADLYARPPRSYAEMEGFEPSGDARVTAAPARRSTSILCRTAPTVSRAPRRTIGSRLAVLSGAIALGLGVLTVTLLVAASM
ncbi:MAG: hypothetical protein SFZ24_07210 [Planctomycetota bacterium]|nr:hypothetical protein [Planctomycetota bacterium]